MTFYCPLCGTEEFLTHGDQLYFRQLCEECQEWVAKREDK